jgi:hypothetical protein
MKKIINKSGISLNAGTLNRGCTVNVLLQVIQTWMLMHSELDLKEILFEGAEWIQCLRMGSA